jgi:hypothetical protein
MAAKLEFLAAPASAWRIKINLLVQSFLVSQVSLDRNEILNEWLKIARHFVYFSGVWIHNMPR